jgi:hypothetical protein
MAAKMRIMSVAQLEQDAGPEGPATCK